MSWEHPYTKAVRVAAERDQSLAVERERRIEQLRTEIANWKRWTEKAEAERDAAVALVGSLRVIVERLRAEACVCVDRSEDER